MWRPSDGEGRLCRPLRSRDQLLVRELESRATTFEEPRALLDAGPVPALAACLEPRPRRVAEYA